MSPRRTIMGHMRYCKFSTFQLETCRIFVIIDLGSQSLGSYLEGSHETRKLLHATDFCSGEAADLPPYLIVCKDSAV